MINAFNSIQALILQSSQLVWILASARVGLERSLPTALFPFSSLWVIQRTVGQPVGCIACTQAMA